MLENQNRSFSNRCSLETYPRNHHHHNHYHWDVPYMFLVHHRSSLNPLKASGIFRDLINVNIWLLVDIGVSQYRSPLENDTFEFFLTHLSRARHVFLVLIGWFLWCEASHRWIAILKNVNSKICSKQRTASLGTSYLAFSQYFSLESKLYKYIALLTLLILSQRPESNSLVRK